MGSIELEFFGPPEAEVSVNPTLRRSGQDQTGGGFTFTGGGNDLEGYGVDLASLLLFVFFGVYIPPAVLRVLLDGIIKFAEWIAGFFMGVPRQAKTLGPGQQLIHKDDPIAHWLGLNLIQAAAQDRVLSEGNWPMNFGGRFIAMGGAMIEIVNREPPGEWWHVRDTPVSSITRFSDAARQFRLGPIPPPKGAPYHQWIVIDGFFAERVRDAAAFKAQFGFDWPTPSQIQQWLNDKGGIRWDDQRVKNGRLYKMRLDFLELWRQSYQDWLDKHPAIPPGPNPDPCGLPEDPPCPPPATNQGDQLTDQIGAESTYFYYIARALTRMAAASGSPQDAVCCANVVNAIGLVSRQISTLTSAIADKPETPVDLTGIIAALGQLLAAVQGWPALWGAAVDLLGGKLDGITNAISNVAAAADPKEISAQLRRMNDQDIIPAALVDQAVKDKVIPAAYAQFFSDKPVGFVHMVLRIAALASKPIGDVERWLGDDSDAEGAERMRLDLIKRSGSALWKTAKGIAAITPEKFSEDLRKAMSFYLTAEDKLFSPIVKPLVEAVADQLKPRAGAAISIGSIGVDPDGPVSAATGVALTAGAAAWALAYAGVDEGEPLAHIAELIAGAVGLEELRDVTIGPLIRNGIAAVADMQAKKTFRQHLPGAGAIASLYARGLLGQAGTDNALALNGLGDSLIELEKKAAYHGLQARQLIRAFESGLFNADDLTDEMTFSGMRPASQHRMQLLAPYLATQSARSQLRSAIEAAYEAGLLSDSDFDARMDGSQHNVDGPSLHRAAVQLKKHLALTKELEASYTTLHEGGITDQATFRAQLEGLGLQPDKVNSLIAVAESKLTVTLKRKADAEERTLVRETVAAERKAAIENFKRGTIGIPELAAALIVTGLTATQAAAWTDLVVLQKAGAQRWIYGLLKTPEEAQLLQQRIAALIDQRKKEFITGSQFVDAMNEMKIPEHFQNALLARANAGITPKKDAFATPVNTSG